MKSNCLFGLFFLLAFNAQAQNRAAYLDAFAKYYRCGNISVTGDKLTVEALVKLNGNGPFASGMSAHDIVSKHHGAEDINYLLRPYHCELTTTTGFYYTDITLPAFSKDSFYHVAMTYDGSMLKFYVNGCVFAQTPASGNMVTNSYTTTIGQLASSPEVVADEQFFGCIDEVRIWNVCRTQNELANNMFDLPSPSSQYGLLAYYKFEGNSVNVQGNAAFDAVPFNGPAIQVQDGFTAIKQFSATAVKQDPTCGQSNGSITINTRGGKAPYKYSLDGVTYQSWNQFATLKTGTYTVYVKSDGVGCSNIMNVALNSVPAALHIYNSDTTIYLGDNVQLSSFSSNGVYSWASSTSLSCTNCANPVASPQTSTTYTLTNGSTSCPGQDRVTITVLPRTQTTTVVAGFTTPDTVCIKTPVTITNTSVGASSYYWNFCVADLNTTPVGTNLGNIGGMLNGPVFMDYAFYNNNYYGFLINHGTGHLIRLNFGNSLLNMPTAVDLGNFGGNIPSVAAEGIQVVQNEGRWYAIIVGGTPSVGYTPRVLKVDFGADLTNMSPVMTNWGNIGNMLHPIDLHVFKEGDNWYGFTVNSDNNTITRFNFTNSFNNTPTAVNLGNVGNLSYPTGIYAINDNGYWRVFIVNGGNNSRSSGVFSLTRLDFGSSLLNTPMGVNLGNPGNMLQHPRDLTIMKMCNQIVGFAVNGHLNNSNTIKIDFNNDLSATPSMSSLGNVGNSSFPHSISKLFRVKDDVYGFVTNVDNNTITRLRFSGCSNASIPNSSLKDPAPVIYNTPGTYSINLAVDDGLATQVAFCRQVVVLPEPQKSPIKNLFICPGESVKIGSGIHPATYTWNTGAVTDSIMVSTPGTYWVESNRFDCSMRDSVIVSYNTTALNPDFSFDQDVCSPKTVQFKANLSNIASYRWDFGDGQHSRDNADPTNTYANYGVYPVKLVVQSTGGCLDSVSKEVALSVIQSDLIYNSDSTICSGDSVLLKVPASASGFCWRSSDNTLTTATPNVYVKPAAATTYYYTTRMLGSNLVFNGSFTDGNTGFVSDYTNSSSGIPEGVYGVRPDVLSWHSGLSACTDHTGSGGNMMLVNGSREPNVRIWSQTVVVTPNTNYVFSAWLQSLFSVNPAELQFSINGKIIGNLFKASSESCHWNQFYTIWNSGASTTATISIVNMNQSFTGNDFALDDIFFGEYQLKTDQVAIRVNPKPDLELGENMTICQDSLVQLNSHLSTGASISWLPALYLSDPATASPSAHPVNTITYLATASHSNGCFKQDSVTITVLQKPTFIRLADTSVCRGESILFNTQGSGATAYIWQPAASLTNSTVANPVATPSASTDYIFRASNQGCSVSDTVRVSVKSLPKVTISADTTICAGAQVQLNAAGGVSYQWSPASALSATSSANPLASPLTTTIYKVAVKDVNGCTGMDSVRLTVNSKPAFAILPANPTVCLGDAITLKATGGDDYRWSPASQIVSPDSDIIEVSPSITTQYKVVIRNRVCQIEDSLYTIVQVSPKPVTSVKKSNDIDCSNFETQLTASGGDQYEWFPAQGLSDLRISNPLAAPSQTTTYNVKVTNQQGCSSLDSITVRFDATGVQRLYVPNAFTPNNDGKNDCFSVRYWGTVKNFSLTLYNRWGEKVFSSANVSNCWDGRYNGVAQPSGVFVYLIKGTTICGEINKKGIITLVR